MLDQEFLDRIQPLDKLKNPVKIIVTLGTPKIHLSLRADAKDKVALVLFKMKEDGKTYDKWIPFSILGKNSNNEIFVERWFISKLNKVRI